MRLTESKLKQLINEVYGDMLTEKVDVAPPIKMPELDIKPLIPKAKEMKATKGKEDIMNEAMGTLIAAVALALPKILLWMEKFVKSYFTDEKISKTFKNLMIKKQIKKERDAAVYWLNFAGHGLHTAYIETIKLTLTRPLSLISRIAGGGKIPEKDQNEIANALFIVLVAMMAFYGFTAIGTAAVKGKLIAKAGTYTIEGLTSIIKAFETTEFAGAVPLALKFLETPHEHHDDEHH